MVYCRSTRKFRPISISSTVWYLCTMQFWLEGCGWTQTNMLWGFWLWMWWLMIYGVEFIELKLKGGQRHVMDLKDNQMELLIYVCMKQVVNIVQLLFSRNSWAFDLHAQTANAVTDKIWYNNPPKKHTKKSQCYSYFDNQVNAKWLHVSANWSQKSKKKPWFVLCSF